MKVQKQQFAITMQRLAAIAAGALQQEELQSETQELQLFFFYNLNSKTTWGSDINCEKTAEKFLAFIFVCFVVFFSSLLRKVTKQLQISKNSTLFMTKRGRAHSQAYVVCRILMLPSRFYGGFFFSEGPPASCSTVLSRVPVGQESLKELIPFACLTCESWAKFFNPMERQDESTIQTRRKHYWCQRATSSVETI